MALVQKAFSDIITFSRSSNATRVGPTGLVEYAPHNLILQSQTFQTTWLSDANRGSITADAAAAPDGTVTAEKLVAGSDNFGYRYQNLTIVNSTVYTASAYLKSSELTFGYIEVPGGNITYFNLSTGVVSAVGSGAAATIISVGNGWYRCSVTFTSNTTSGFVNLGAANASGSQAATNGSGIYIWGAQLSVGPYALDYTPTTSAAVYGPRFDYDPSGVTIVDPVSRNLLTYSEQFDNAAWTKRSIALTGSQSAPNGSSTAFLAVPSTATFADMYIAASGSSAMYTVSFFAKASGKNWIYLLSAQGASANWAWFNLTNGVVGTTNGAGLSATITSAGNGWYRCTVSQESVSNYVQIGISDADGSVSVTGSGSNGVFIWGAQLELGSTATGYMVSGATNGFRAVPVTSGTATARGLLVEEQRTNLVTYSSDFSDAVWSKSQSSIVSNINVAPDGTVTAHELVENTANDLHRLNTPSFAAGTYTLSVYAKADTRTKFEIVTQPIDVGFDLSAGTVLYGTGGTITPVGNGWYRCSVTFTQASTATMGYGLLNASGQRTYTGDGYSGIYIWGAQLEAGSFATSYIPTLASTVTRSADVASVDTLSPWFNATEGTFYTESVTNAIGTSPASFVNTGSSDIIGLGYSGANQSRLYIETSGVTQANLAVSYSGSVVKEAAVYKLNDAQNCANGTLSSQDTSVTLPSINKLNIGYFPTALTYQNGWIRRLAYFPRRLSSAELQALTA